MDELKQEPSQQVPTPSLEPTLASAPVKPSGQIVIDINKLFLPGAILLAGILISGTLLYTNMDSDTGAAQGGNEANLFATDNLKKWGKSVGISNSEFISCIDSQKYKDEVAKDTSDGTAAGVGGTPSFFVNGTQLVGAQPFESFKVAIDEALTGKKGSVVVSTDDDPSLGDPNAPVTIIEFSDFQCPYCRRFWEQTLPQLKSEYIDTGKVRLVYRDYPLSTIHPGALPAAMAAGCANEQGKFWEYHDQIFEEQG
jgi:protein-disulfide isomerase